ncbi:MAG: hypothetical protein ACI9OJ_005967 [Myxococcota bacterium]|jgi:hypothetical protein
MSSMDGTPGVDGTDGLPGVDGLTALDGTSDGTDATDGTDAQDATDGAWPQEAPPFPDAPAPWCEQMHDQPVGEQIVVIDWLCPVAEQCAGGGVLAQCNPETGFGGDVWYCSCNVYGQECYPINNLAECPNPAAAEGDACDVQIEDSCGAGLFCELDANEPDPEVYPFENTKGLCKPLPICSGGIACYDDSECSQGYTCRDAQPANGMPGTCREPTLAPTCLVDSDCPQGWECAGETLGCDHACECANPTAADSAGQCIKETGFSDPTIWVADTVFWSGQPIAPFWTKGAIGENLNWITCPSYDIEVQEPKTLSWYKLGSEPWGDNEAGLVELAPGAFIPVAPFTVTAAPEVAYTSVRLVARYYTGCENAQSPLTCEGGPYDTFYQPIFVIPVDAPTQ